MAAQTTSARAVAHPLSVLSSDVSHSRRGGGALISGNLRVAEGLAACDSAKDEPAAVMLNGTRPSSGQMTQMCTSMVVRRACAADVVSTQMRTSMVADVG